MPYPTPHEAGELAKLAIEEGVRTSRILDGLGDSFILFSVGDLRPVGVLVVHCASVYRYVATAFSIDRWDTELLDLDAVPGSMAGCVQMLQAERMSAIVAAEAVSPTRWLSPVAAFGFVDSVGSWLRRAIDHEIHHRGEICVYAAIGGHPVEDMYSCIRNRDVS
jgi:DinB family